MNFLSRPYVFLVCAKIRTKEGMVADFPLILRKSEPGYLVPLESY